MAEVSVEVLLGLPNKEYNEILFRSLHPSKFSTFMDPRIVRRTQRALAGAETSIHKQIRIATENGTADADWLRRAGVKAMQFRRFLGIVEGAIQHYPTIREDKKEARKWREFSESLAEVALGTEAEARLHDIETPFGGLTAFEWLAKRRDKR